MIHQLKARLEWLACRSWIGTLVSRLHGDWIRSPSLPRGFPSVHVCAPRHSVSDATRASLFWGFHEAQEIRYVERYLPADLDVIELGSSLGIVSAHIARKLGITRKLVCVEANPRVSDLLQQTLQRNAPNANVQLISSAIGYGVDSLKFEISEDVITSHVAQSSAESIDVPATTLAAVAGDTQDYSLVCDIEGAESEILENDAASLSRCRMMIIELHDSARSIEQMVRRIENLGFRRRASHGAVYVFERE